MKVDVTVTVVGSAPYLLRTAHNVPRLCESLGYLPPQPPEHPEALADGVDRDVDGAQSLLRDCELSEVDHAHERLGRLLGESIVMVPVRVRS